MSKRILLVMSLLFCTFLSFAQGIDYTSEIEKRLQGTWVCSEDGLRVQITFGHQENPHSIHIRGHTIANSAEYVGRFYVDGNKLYFGLLQYKRNDGPVQFLGTADYVVVNFNLLSDDLLYIENAEQTFDIVSNLGVTQKTYKRL